MAFLGANAPIFKLFKGNQAPAQAQAQAPAAPAVRAVDAEQLTSTSAPTSVSQPLASFKMKNGSIGGKQVEYTFTHAFDNSNLRLTFNAGPGHSSVIVYPRPHEPAAVLMQQEGDNWIADLKGFKEGDKVDFHFLVQSQGQQADGSDACHSVTVQNTRGEAVGTPAAVGNGVTIEEKHVMPNGRIGGNPVQYLLKHHFNGSILSLALHAGSGHSSVFAFPHPHEPAAVPMRNEGDHWVADLHGFKEGDQMEVYFAIQNNGEQVDNSTSKHRLTLSAAKAAVQEIAKAANIPAVNELADVHGTYTPSAPPPPVSVSTSTIGSIRGDKNYFVLKIRNNSNLKAEIFILGKGQDPAYYKDSQYTMIESYMQFDDRGYATFVPATKAGVTAKYAKKLAEFPKDPKDKSVHVLRIPKTIGGRLYFSLGEPIFMSVVDGKDPAGRPVTRTLSEPDPFKLDDPSYLTVYDKIEFTFNDMGVWIDTTAVDFFCMPISMYYEGQPKSSVGISQSRSTVLKKLEKEFQGPWGNLKLAYTNPDKQQAVLRILAPNKAIGRRDKTQNFPEKYLQSYIHAVWDYYRAPGRQLKVDCSELVNFGYTLGDVKGGKLTKENCIFTGKVASDGSTFHFENSTHDEVDVLLPHSNEVFGCDGGSMTCRPNMVSSVIVRELGAAMNVGLLPLPNQMTNPKTRKSEDVMLCKPFFCREDVRKMFYQNSPHLPSAVDGYAYNLYSKVLHSFGEKVYAFAFDDAVGEDSTLHSSDDDANVPDVSTPYVVVIGDMTGTVIPDITDHKTYNVRLVPGWNAKGTHNGQGFAWPNNLVVKGLKSPFQMQYDIGHGLETYEIHVNIQRVRCLTSPSKSFLGVDWHMENGELTIALEGATK